MRVMVLGAGLLGVTSAYYLQQLGHHVTVLDRHSQPAANALGRERELSDAAQAATDALVRAAHAARQRGPLQPVRAGLRRWLGALPCRSAGGAPSPQEDPGELMEDLCDFSWRTAHVLRIETAAPVPAPGQSLLRFYTDRRAFETMVARQPRLKAMGCERLLLSADEASRVEPVLRSIRPRLAGATLALDDPSGDASGFASELVFLCRAAGAQFLMRHTVAGLHAHQGRISHIEVVNSQGERCELRADAYVLALGPASMRHAQQLGVALPLRFVREYRLHLPVHEDATLPRHALCNPVGRGFSLRRQDLNDAPAIVARTTAGIDLLGPLAPQQRPFERLREHAKALMPGALDIRRALPDSRVLALSSHGLPLIGRTHLPNLFLNTAPGQMGWVNACGAGKSIAHIVSGLRPEVAFAFTGL